jgi:cysteinyl-tRNA synthetase
MIDLVRRLEARGVAYQAEDGSVYFAIGRFPGYGRLSRLDTREIKAGARVLQDEYGKENPQDFALWKAATEADERAGARGTRHGAAGARAGTSSARRWP